MPLTATRPEVFVNTMTEFLSDSYDDLEDNLTHTKSLKLKSYPGDNVTYFCAAILVDAELLDSAKAFKYEHLGYTTRIFEDKSDSRFRIWAIHKYKEVMDFIKKLRLCDMDVTSPEELITYDYLVQEATHEYHDLVNSKQWKPATGKENSQDQTSLPKE